jgi:hypothetical protein
LNARFLTFDQTKIKNFLDLVQLEKS